ncbi:MAG: hypothetical protein ACM3KM_01840 [Acidobacteriaceae bacterium]
MPKAIEVDSKIEKNGLTVIVNKKPLKLEYPEFVWSAFPRRLKEVFQDNITLSSTFFVPQILNIPEIHYKTSRPISEVFLFKNGIYDMPASANVDQKSSVSYLKKFVNTVAAFKDDQISLPEPQRAPRKPNKDIVIPFTFGKDSLLSAAVAKEIGLKVHLVYFIEPSHAFEYQHKKPLIKAFEKIGLPVHTVKYGPGSMRYGKLWNKQTELGWGLQTTEYALLSLPFLYYWNAPYIAFGNEHSCGESGIDEEGVLTYWTAYDQHPDWTAQQGLLVSLVGGSPVKVLSLVEPLHEMAEIAVLYRRYPELAKYQMSCLALNKSAKKNRWCQNCEKCGAMYAFMKAVGIDVKSAGFTKDLFDRNHLHLFKNLFFQKNNQIYYGMEEEVYLAMYLSLKRGEKGEVIEQFKKLVFPKFKLRVSEYLKEYFGVYKSRSMPDDIRKKVLPLFEKELSAVRRELTKYLR